MHGHMSLPMYNAMTALNPQRKPCNYVFGARGDKFAFCQKCSMNDSFRTSSGFQLGFIATRFK